MSGFTAALRIVDTLTRTGLPSDSRLRRRSLAARARIITFYVGSPPETTFLANLPWLAFFISVLGLVANYDKIKKNVPEIMRDVENIVRHVRGLTERQRQHLSLAVRALIDEMLNIPEQQLRTLANRIARARQRLTGLQGELPDIEIIDLEDPRNPDHLDETY